MTQEFKGQTEKQTAGPPKSDDDVVSRLIDGRVKTFTPYNRSRNVEWNINIAYLMGRQYIGLDNGHIVSVPKSPFAVTANKLLPAVQNDVAQVTKVPPKFDVIPTGTDDDDRATAIAGQKMTGYLRRINNFDIHRGRIMTWIDIAAIGWRKNVWSPNHKIIGYNPEPEEQGHNPEMAPGQPIYQGEAISYHVPNNEVIYDWREDIDNLSWAIHARPMSVGQLMQMFGEKALALEESDFYDPDGSEFEVKLFNEFKDAFEITTEPDESEMANIHRQAMVYELWQSPNEAYPMGIYSIKAGSKVMQNVPYPKDMYPHLEVPLVPYAPMFVHNAVSGTGSRLSQARPLQTEVNDIRTLIKENTIMLGGGLWMVPRGSKVDRQEVDNGVGLWLEYDGIQKPTREQGVPPSGQLFLYVEKIENDIDELFAFHDASKGKMPVGGPKSGIGLMSLQEADLTQSSPIIREFERKDERSMYQLLSIAFANYNQRSLEIIGKDNEWTLFEFDPKSFTQKFNVVVQSGSSLPISKAYERDLALNLGQSGWLGNPADPAVRRKVLEVIDIGGLDAVLKDNAKDTNFAKKEFSVPAIMAQQGELPYMPPPNQFDSHDVHIIEHRKDLLDHYWEYLQTGDSNFVALAQAMMDHYTMHEQIVQQIMLQQAILSGQYTPPDEKPNESAGQSKE